MTDNNCQFDVDDCRCALKLYADKLIRRVSDIDAELLRESSRKRTSKIDDSSRGEPNDGSRKECDDSDRPCNRGNVRSEKIVDNFEKKLNHMQQIVNAVVELLRYYTKENPPYATINRLRALSTSIMMNLKEALNVSCSATSFKEKTAETAQMKTGVKRRRADVNERAEDVEHDAAKRRKTDKKNSEISSMVNEIGELCELQTNDHGTKKQNESNERLLKFTSVIVNELLPYYKKNYFSNEDLFKFMVKTIVCRLKDSTICPEDHTVKSTIWQMMPQTRIKSEHQILTILEPFY